MILYFWWVTISLRTSSRHVMLLSPLRDNWPLVGLSGKSDLWTMVLIFILEWLYSKGGGGKLCLSWGCYNKNITDWSGLKTKHFFFPLTIIEARKSKIKVLADQMSDEVILLNLETAICLLYLHMSKMCEGEKKRKREGGTEWKQALLIIEALILFMKASPQDLT